MNGLKRGLGSTLAALLLVGLSITILTPATCNADWTGGHDVVGCTEPSTTWYFAEGTTRYGFNEWLCLLNPNQELVDVWVDYMVQGGPNVQKQYRLPSTSRTTIDVCSTIVPQFDISIKVFSSRPIVAERSMYFRYLTSWTGGHAILGANAPQFEWYFAEGTTRPGFDPYLCIQNPQENESEVKITYMLGDKTTREQLLEVAPQSRETVVVSDFLGVADDPAHDFSARVETTNNTPIVVERPTYFSYKNAWPGGHDVMGAISTAQAFYFAEGTTRPGFDPYLCIQNPQENESEVKITYMLGDKTTREQLLEVAPQSRETVVVSDFLGVADDPAHDFSARVETTNNTPIVVERPTYFSYTPTTLWSLSGVGDVNLGGDMNPVLAANGFWYPWSLSHDFLESTTLTFANLECTMSYRGSPVPGKTFTFRGDPDALPEMRNAGIDVVSQANNHARDYGPDALLDCLAYLEGSGIAHCGAGADYAAAYVPAVLDANGLKIDFLAYDEIGYYNWYADVNYPGVCDATNTPQIVTDIVAAKQSSDLVVVSFHWGTEKKYTPDPVQYNLAHLAIDCGADLVLGHHPHVVQGFEFYKDKLIAYSLGNFVFNPGSPECRYTILTHFFLDARGCYSVSLLPYYIAAGRPEPMSGSAAQSWLAQVASLSHGLGTPMTVHDGYATIP